MFYRVTVVPLLVSFCFEVRRCVSRHTEVDHDHHSAFSYLCLVANGGAHSLLASQFLTTWQQLEFRHIERYQCLCIGEGP